ncbi:uncharacterized protein GGS25DRAFT_219107 [Hypoxylon fragiforme]|uniref:uncharacterized protein n=1 Tax=Hypoxylon fragiforme TaxID=63214 RepID=UPI0020C5E442|nr:uncharacterized protein GGS25DRAFT_219107 [Hypoxylon fragiforme]KAI2609506.1 hypothetical protein GGS25DRAFT_219107 [Hypoxylon fragiforme]
MFTYTLLHHLHHLHHLHALTHTSVGRHDQTPSARSFGFSLIALSTLVCTNVRTWVIPLDQNSTLLLHVSGLAISHLLYPWVQLLWIVWIVWIPIYIMVLHHCLVRHLEDEFRPADWYPGIPRTRPSISRIRRPALLLILCLLPF